MVLAWGFPKIEVKEYSEGRQSKGGKSESQFLEVGSSIGATALQ